MVDTNKDSEIIEYEENPNDNDETNNNEEVVLTIENNEDLKKLLELKDESDPFIEEFAGKYYGRTIEFDGCITYLGNHITNNGKIYKTRYDILFGAGDYHPDTQRGPYFKYEDVNRYDMGLESEGIHLGENVRLKAKVGKYNKETLLFLLEPISMEER